ncbi:S9 family peptidase [Aestuariibaculum sediminum]|uniref:S9 family peptidase n=1 Tax=Aestuariibaculum sediminum TaxID=2770637 RepID=A0A8J6Q2D2_9FLAO|nr:S9 family peptidase [Aestuariibaculum sediminum]MBD0831994.1 S9 family peptidase [Aestuariibaculum sediminum]
MTKKVFEGYLLLFLITSYSGFSLKAQNVSGSWKGQISVQGNEIPIIFNIQSKINGYRSTMDSPSQGSTGIPMDFTSFENDTLTVLFASAGLKYVGLLKNNSITGILYQNGLELPLSLNKTMRKLPGNTSLPSSKEELNALGNSDIGNYKYAVNDYFAKPKASAFSFSPNGNYLSYREKDDKLKNHVYVKNLKTNETVRVIEEKEELIRGFGWANNNRLIYIMDKGGNEEYHLFAVDLDGNNQIELTPFEGVKVNILKLLKEDKDHMVISMNQNNPQVFEPYKINIVSGEINQLYKNDDDSNPINSYEFDKDGELKGFFRLRDGVNVDFYYRESEENYELKKKLNWKDHFNIVAFNYSSDNPHEAYVLSNLESDKTEIFLYDLKADKVLKTLYSNPDFDASGLRLSRHRNYELDYFSFQGDKKVIIPVSSYYKKLHKKITTEFPGYNYSIADVTDDESKYLVFIQSDKLYGKYFEYDATNKTFKLLYDLMPNLKEEDMAEMHPITYQSRDGLTIHGYITLPNTSISGQKVPLIVNPHGGPQGIRDSWGFNPEAQLFASRGYATLQVNFRISGGYGRAFLESGFKQIGRKAMDDVEDGVQYVVNQGWIDKDRVAIYGGSHGGYAVLRGLTKTPDLYACGVDYVGVSNLFTFMKTIPPYWKPYLKIIKEIWYDEDVSEEKDIMNEVSPVFHINKIKKPLFVVQGANDPRVNIDESDQIVEALRKKGFDIPYMVKYDEGHGFAKEENRIELYQAMLGFFAKHLKPNFNESLKK